MKKLLPKDKQEWISLLRNTGLILFGTFILAFGIEMFIFPFSLVTGGVSGIGIILANCFEGLKFLGDIGADLYSSIVNWILFGVGFLVLGKEFAAKTLVSTIFYPIALELSKMLIHADVFSGMLDLTAYIGTSYYGISLIVATVFGGTCIGMGCAFTFLGGGSTGGVDVIALALTKYVRKLKSSVTFFLVDAAIIIIGIISVNNILLSLLGIISAFICATSIDKIFLGESSAFIAHVVSDKYEEINREVIAKMSRTTTIISATGGYSGQDKKLVMITFNMRQYPIFTQIISGIDKNAFVTVHRAHEINGEGWTFEPQE